ncbi:MAG: Gfo/Idh/MocA family oxidoreductase, partial [Acidobacteriia bacterium]|nr:Gfo/Idh/MocA family oxidoreductase [Terriglobia bacterium]
MAGRLRVGLVGARFAARFHWEGYRRVYGVPVEVVGVTAKGAESPEAFARERGIRAFASFEALCDAVDVIDLCTPGSTHEPLAVEAFRRGKHVIIEKPFTGYYGPGKEDFRGDRFPKDAMLREAMASCDRILAAARAASRRLCYAENWVYAPAIQKEREILAKSGGQVLWIIGDESHSGSHSPYYGIWKFSGGGSLVGKGCHPLTAALYLKRAEGEARGQMAVRPATVSARTHAITRLKNFRDAGFPVGWFLVDDGWFDQTGSKLNSFRPDTAKFPHGFRNVIRTLKEEYHLKDVGVWHALNGYWQGINPESALGREYGRDLITYRELAHPDRDTTTWRSCSFVSPLTDAPSRFYNEFHRLLSGEGFTFVKVDNQLVVERMAEGNFPV